MAASANNANCGVGIAFNSKIAGIRFLEGGEGPEIEADGNNSNKPLIV